MYQSSSASGSSGTILLEPRPAARSATQTPLRKAPSANRDSIRTPSLPAALPASPGLSSRATPPAAPPTSPGNGSHEKAPAPNPIRTIRLLLADDHPVVRTGLRSCLSARANLSVVGEAQDGFEALRLSKELSPDVVVMDLDMPKMDGLAAAQAIRREMPHVKVLILSMHSDSDYVMRIVQCGASGYVLKDVRPDELAKAIEAIHGGGSYFSPSVAQVALNQFVRGRDGDDPDAQLLTNRERDVLVRVAQGLSNKEIASSLNIGVRTVETHRERIMRKLNVHTIAGLTRFALAKKYISLNDTTLR